MIMTRRWVKIQDNTIYRVSFALGDSYVILLKFFDYKKGRVFHIRDTRTGHCDFVGFEFIKKARVEALNTNFLVKVDDNNKDMVNG